MRPFAEPEAAIALAATTRSLLRAVQRYHGRAAWARRCWTVPDGPASADVWPLARALAGKATAPAFAFRAPEHDDGPVRAMACVDSIALVDMPAGPSKALDALWQSIAGWGPAPPGGAGHFPLLACALPFFWGSGPVALGPPEARRTGQGRLCGTTLVRLRTKAGLRTVVAWCARLPPALRGPRATKVAPGASRARHEAASALAAEYAEHVQAVLRACQQVAREQAAARSLVAGHTPKAAVELHIARPQAQKAFARRVDAAVATLTPGGRGPSKVVLARWARAVPPPGQAFEPWALACQRGRDEPAAHVFFWPEGGAGAAFVGSSPERLLRMRGRQLATHAVAGTARRCDDPQAAALMASDKDRREHLLVVRRLVQALTPLSERVRAARQVRPLATQSLWHLETPVVATLSAAHGPLRVASRLHPTPALCGSPKRWALSCLLEQEPWRGLYGGAIGWVAPASAHLAVAIRSASVTPTQATLYAGAGIVVGSDGLREWRETAAKLAPMKAALQRCSVPSRSVARTSAP